MSLEGAATTKRNFLTNGREGADPQKGYNAHISDAGLKAKASLFHELGLLSSPPP